MKWAVAYSTEDTPYGIEIVEADTQEEAEDFVDNTADEEIEILCVEPADENEPLGEVE